jgi:hypothetical protein
MARLACRNPRNRAGPGTLAGVEPDSDRHGEIGIVEGLRHEPFLKIDSGGDGLSSRGEDGERFVSSQFDHVSAASLDGVSRDPGELGGQLRGRLVTSLLRE